MLNLKLMRRMSVVTIGVALFGCQSRMAYFDGDESMVGTVPASVTPFYLGEANCPSDFVSSDQIKRMLIDDPTIAKFVSRNGAAEDAIPLTVTVARKEAAANGAIASVNNFFSFFTLTIWPWVSSSEYQYDVTLSSAIGKHSCQFIVGERDWSGLTPIAMIPVPGWADERGDKSEIMDYHAKSIVTALVNIMAQLPSDYEVFKKNPERYRKAIAFDKSAQALRLFMKTKDERTRGELLAQVVDEDVVSKGQKVFFEAYRSSSSGQLKKNLAEKLTGEWVDRLPYDNLSVLRWRKTTNQAVLANVYRRNVTTLSSDDAAALAKKITDEGTLKRMVVKGAELYVEDAHAREALYSQVKSPETLQAIAVSEAFSGVDRKDLSKLELPYGEVVYDVKLDKARSALSHINNQIALKALALTDKHFSIRAAAIERLEDEAVLDKIVAEKIEKCPYDTSLSSYRPYEDRMEWIQENSQISEIRLTQFAIARMKNVARLRELRKTMGAPALRKVITARLAALGHNDVEELCACEVYDANLFSMLNGMTNEVELLKVAREAKLRGVRVSAALRCKSTDAVGICGKEVAAVVSKVKDGQLHVGCLHLGMDIQDALAVFAAHYQSVGPRLRVNDDDQLCIVDEKKREIVRAKPEELTVNWITLPPSVVQEIVGVKSGTFADLEKAVLKGFGVKFLSGTIRKGDVSQKVATVDTIGGETLRYFRDEVAIGDNIGRKARRHAMDMAVMMPGEGAAESIIAGALAEATDNEINKENAQSDCFAKQGSLQLLPTADAEKCTQGNPLSESGRLAVSGKRCFVFSLGDGCQCACAVDGTVEAVCFHGDGNIRELE